MRCQHQYKCLKLSRRHPKIGPEPTAGCMRIFVSFFFFFLCIWCVKAFKQKEKKKNVKLLDISHPLLNCLGQMQGCKVAVLGHLKVVDAHKVGRVGRLAVLDFA